MREVVAGEYARRQAGKSVRKRLEKLLDEATGACRPGTITGGTTPCASRPSARATRWSLPGPSMPAIWPAAIWRLRAMRSSGCRRFWARSTIATCGSRISGNSPPRSRARSGFTSAVRSGSSACGPGFDYMRREREGPPPPGLRRAGDLLAGVERPRGLGPAGDHLGIGRHSGSNCERKCRGKSDESHPAEVAPRA